jgi:hypothetical protein
MFDSTPLVQTTQKYNIRYNFDGRVKAELHLLPLPMQQEVIGKIYDKKIKE